MIKNRMGFIGEKKKFFFFKPVSKIVGGYSKL
uniref:Uncharacterized protein n=1 Tax=viral metagenome TaxID=1070528 RepID=A0A6C0K5D4_9ZZZZ